MTPEGQLKKDCRDLARLYGLMFYNVQGKQINGIPDTICGHMDRLGIVWIEFKRPGKEPSEQQWDRIKELRDAGERADWCDSIEKFRKLVGID